MRYPTVYTTPSERPKFDFLLTKNYLSEYSSEVDKARVRENLGIPDEFNLYWGNIKGNIANLTDVINLVNLVNQGLNNNMSVLEHDINSLQKSLTGYSAELTDCKDLLKMLEPHINKFQHISAILDDMRTDIAQNATNIQLLSGSDTSISGLPDLVSYLKNQYQDLQSLVSANTAKTNLNSSNIAAMQTSISVNTTNITALQTQVAKLGDVTSVTGLSGQVEANVTLIANLITRCNSIDALLSALKDTVGNHTQDIYSFNNQLTNFGNTITSLTNTINAHSTSIANLQQQHSLYDSAIMFANINSNTEKISSLQSRLDLLPNQSSLIMRIANLESKLGEVVMTDLTVTSTSINVTTQSTPIAVVIKAVYSSNASTDVTTMCSVSSSDTSVAYWYNGYIQIAGPGIATITYQYNGFTATTVVSVTNAIQIVPSYIGFAMTADEVVLNASCKINQNSIGGTYTPHEVTEGPYYLWIVTPSTIRSFIENNMWSYDVPGDNIEVTAKEYNGSQYNVYKFHGEGLFGEPDTLNEPTTITITTN